MESDQKRALLAVSLSVLVFMGWQYFFPPNTSVTVAPLSTTTTEQENLSQTSAKKSVSNSDELKEEKYERKNKLVDSHTAENERLRQSFHAARFKENSFEISGLLQIKNWKSTHAKKSLDDILGERGSVQLRVRRERDSLSPEGKFVPFTESEVLYVDEYNEYELRFTPDEATQDLISVEVKSLRQGEDDLKLEVLFVGHYEGPKDTVPSEYVFYQTDTKRIPLDKSENSSAPLYWAGVDRHHHLLAVIFGEDRPYTIFNVHENGTLLIFPLKGTNKDEIKLIFAEKNYTHLESLHHHLELAVDFGFFGLLAVPILKALLFFYYLVPNYGLAIILLTLLLRLLTFPLQYQSFKGMKKMQLLAPQIAKIKERYPDDAPRQQMETMHLFKKSGVNPWSGCLPMLLQFPIFIAFYKVLYNAVELIDAPFFFWLQDLSSKDPYYVLPILLTASMFLHQKMTPNTSTDPNQQKIMMFMPLVFGFVMKDMPAGLCLYSLVSTLAGLVQQMVVFKRLK